MRSLLLAAGLFLLAPLVAEFLLGNLPITALYALVLLAPLYGGGALLIREVVRRRGLGWPSILVLALAYGVLEEGITTMSLFNPNYAGERLLDSGYISLLGIGVPWTVFVLALHTVWSISVPIVFVETLADDWSLRPWLGKIGLGVTSVLFVFGVVATTAVSLATYQFVASAPQIVGTLVVVALLVWVGLGLFKPAAPAPTLGSHPAPPAIAVGAAALVVSSAFKVLPRSLPAVPYVAIVLVLAAGSIWAIWTCSRLPGWGEAHRLALGSGALLTYAWTAFPQTPVMPATPTQDLVGNIIFALGALMLIGVTAWQVHVRATRCLPTSALGPRPAPSVAT